MLGLAYLYSGAYAKACGEFRANLSLLPDSAVARAHLARCHIATHHDAEARATLAALEQHTENRATSAVEIAATQAALGERDAALQ